MSIIYDNRSRIGVRIGQLKTGRRHTQTPRSELARIIANIEIAGRTENEFEVRANAFISKIICAARPPGRLAMSTGSGSSTGNFAWCARR